MLRRHPVERWWLCIHVASALPGNMAAGLNWNKASILKLTWPMGFPTFCQATCLHGTICPQKGGHGIFYAVVKSLFVAIFAPWVSTKNSEQIFFWHTLRVKPSRFQMICSQVASRWYGESACWLAAPFGTSSNLAMKEREAVIHWYVLQPWVCVYIYTPVCNVEIYINKNIYIETYDDSDDDDDDFNINQKIIHTVLFLKVTGRTLPRGKRPLALPKLSFTYTRNSPKKVQP